MNVVQTVSCPGDSARRSNGAAATKALGLLLNNGRGKQPPGHLGHSTRSLITMAAHPTKNPKWLNRTATGSPQTGLGEASVAFWTDKPGQAWENFCHATDELVSVLWSEMEFVIGKATHHPKPGEELLIPTGVVHSARNVRQTLAR